MGILKEKEINNFRTSGMLEFYQQCTISNNIVQPSIWSMNPKRQIEVEKKRLGQLLIRPLVNKNRIKQCRDEIEKLENIILEKGGVDEFMCRM